MITSSGKVHLAASGTDLSYFEYELREKGNILVCLETPESKSISNSTNKTPITVWYGVGYSLAILSHMAALIFNIILSRKTTVRIILINYTIMGLIWAADSLLCTVSLTYSDIGLSLHLLGSLGVMTWLLIMTFHLLLSVTDGNPAVYFSVDNLVYYHLFGWFGPTIWVLPFFLLSKFKVNSIYIFDINQIHIICMGKG